MDYFQKGEKLKHAFSIHSSEMLKSFEDDHFKHQRINWNIGF